MNVEYSMLLGLKLSIFLVTRLNWFIFSDNIKMSILFDIVQYSVVDSLPAVREAFW